MENRKKVVFSDSAVYYLFKNIYFTKAFFIVARTGIFDLGGNFEGVQ